MADKTKNVSLDNISWQPVLAPVDCFTVTMREPDATTNWIVRRPTQDLGDDFPLLPGEGFQFVQPGAGFTAGQIMGYAKLVDVASATFRMSGQ